MRHPLRFLPALAALAMLLAAPPAPAQDASWSAFGSLGYARSNRDYHYLRNIDSGGSFDTDSVLGAQGDLRLNPQWSATVQLKLAQSLKSDSRWDLTPSWAFVAWRPTDDWLLRAGRMRAPLYLQSESMDVGVTHDMARLPVEMYTLAPSSDFAGLSVARTWSLGSRDLSLDLYSGQIGTSARFWLRDGAPPQYGAGANFVDVKLRSSGLVLTLRSPEGTVRGGLHRTSLRRSDGQPIATSYPFVEVAPGIGYYQVDDQLPGPGVPVTGSISNTIYTVGLEQTFLPGWRIAAEYARIAQRDTELGSDSHGGYVALFHSMGRFTPYASWGRLRSSDGTIGWNERLTTNLLPAFIPGADQINAAQRTAGETGYAVDQHSTALGASFAIDAGQKVKLEWLHTRIGRVSRLVDTPQGQESPRHTSIDTLSVGYHFSF